MSAGFGPRPRPRGAAIPLSPRMIATAGLGVAFLCGALMARGPATGLGLLFLLLYGPLVLFDLPVALAIWIVITFVKYLPVVSIGPTAASLLVLAGWAGAVAGRRGMPSGLALARVLPLGMGLLLTWLTLSAVWADDPGAVLGKVWTWYVAALVLIVVAGTVRTRRDVELVMAGFVGGAVLSVAIGLIDNGLAGASSAYETATSTEGRLQGGSGDPNYLAAGVVPAIVLAGGLLQVRRDALSRLGLWTSLLILVIGLFATESRGGMIAAFVALVLSLAVMKGRRTLLLAGTAMLVGVGALWLAANPDAIQRLTSTDSGGNGRSELWTVAWRMANDNPLTGVGLDNYRERSPDYVLGLADLRFVDLIAERPHVVHNAYLQSLAETGIVGLVFLLIVFGGAVWTALRAGRRFERAGDAWGAPLSRALLVAIVAMLCSSFFLSNGEDGRMWLLFGLAPALLFMTTSERR